MDNFNKIKSQLSTESIYIIENKITTDLSYYVFNSISDTYNKLDDDPRLNHISTVIDSSLKLSKFYNLN